MFGAMDWVLRIVAVILLLLAVVGFGMALFTQSFTPFIMACFILLAGLVCVAITEY